MIAQTTEKSNLPSIEVNTSILEQAIKATKQTDRWYAEELLRSLTENALKGVISYDKNLVTSLNNAIAEIDKTLSKQLTKIMHHPLFKQLEGSWRGLHYLVINTETSASMRIKVLNIAKDEIQKDLSKATEFDQSQLFKKVYESEFGTPGGEPYGLMIGDFEFNNYPDDLDMLSNISQTAAAAFCPFISAASAKMFGFDNWSELAKPRDLEKIFDTLEYAKWRSFREMDDARFITLTMPRVLARLPYGTATLPVEAFNYEEISLTNNKMTAQLAHDNYCWMNAGYPLAVRITTAQTKFGFATAIRGAEGGGKVDNLPLHTFLSDDGDPDSQCPTEIGITDRREAELSKLGFLPLCHYKNTNYATYFGGQSVQKLLKYDKPEANANAAISARLPYLLATARFAHYLKVMARDKIGAFLEVEECEAWLNHWILGYVNGNSGTKQELKAKYPLAEAKIEVQEIPGHPGAYHAIAWLRPWLQMEELTTSMRLVARIPKIAI